MEDPIVFDIFQIFDITNLTSLIVEIMVGIVIALLIFWLDSRYTKRQQELLSEIKKYTKALDNTQSRTKIYGLQKMSTHTDLLIKNLKNRLLNSETKNAVVISLDVSHELIELEKVTITLQDLIDFEIYQRILSFISQMVIVKNYLFPLNVNILILSNVAYLLNKS